MSLSHRLTHHPAGGARLHEGGGVGPSVGGGVEHVLDTGPRRAEGIPLLLHSPCPSLSVSPPTPTTLSRLIKMRIPPFLFHPGIMNFTHMTITYDPVP